MIRRPPRSTQSRSSAASDVYKRQVPLELIGTPGYGTFMREAFPFRYTFRKEAKLQIELVNQDIAVLNGGADAYHKVSFNLVGKKFLNVALPAGV